MSLRRVTRWTLGVLTGVFLIAATSAVVVESDWFKERLRRIAVSRASEILDGQLSIGRLNGSLLRGLELEHVVFQQAGGPVVSVERISVRYDWRLLVKRHFVFDELVLARPVIHITQRADGWNILHLVKPRSSQGPGTSLWFKKMTLTDATVSIEPMEQPARHFAGLNAGLDLSYTPTQTDLTVNTLSGRDADSGWQIDRGKGAFHNTAARMSGSVQLTSNAGTILADITGTPGSGGRRVEGKAAVSQLNLAPVLARSNFGSDLTGNVAFQTFVSSTASATSSPISFQVDAASASAAGYAAQNIHGRGSYGDGVLHLDGEANAYGAWATAKGEWRTPYATRLANSWALSGRFRDLDVRNVPERLQMPTLATQLAGQYDVSLVPDGWAVALRLTPSVIEGAQLSNGTTARAEAHGGAAPHYEASGHVTRLDPQRLSTPLHIAMLGEARFKGTINGDFHVDGHGRGLDDHVLVANGTLIDSTLGPTHVPSADVAVNLSARRLTFDFTGPFEHLTHEEVGLAADTDTPFNLSGTANARIVFHDVRAPVTIHTVDADGHVALGASNIAGYDVDRADLDGTLAAGAATVRTLTVEGAELHATANGTVAFDSEGTSDLTFVVDASTLATLGKRIDQPIAGAARLEGKVTGPADHLTATGTLASHDVKYGTSIDALTVNGTVTVNVANQQWRDFSATAVTDATFLTLAGVEVPHMTATSSYHADRLDVKTTLEQKDRTLQVAGGLLFHPDHKEVHVEQLDLATGGVTWSLPAGQAATINYANDRVDIAGLALTRGAQRLSVDGMLATAPGKAVSTEGLDVKADSVDIGDLNRLMLGTLTLTGTATGHAHVTGTTSDPNITSTFSIVKGSVEGTPFDALTADAGYHANRVTLNATLDQQPGARLTAVGSVPYASGAAGVDLADAPVDLRVESTPIDLGIFAALTTELSAIKGTGLFNVRITGTSRAPSVNGTADVSNASFSVAATGISYLGGTARLRFDGEHVAIEQFVLHDDDLHTMTAEGGMDVTGGTELRSVDVHVVLDQMHLLRNKFGEVGLDADLKVSGALQHLTITGTSSVERGRLEIDRLIEQFTSSAYVPEAGDATADVSAIPGMEKLDALDPKYKAEQAKNAAAASAATAAGPSPSKSAASGIVASSTGTLFDNATVNVHLDMPDNVIVRAQDIRLVDSPVSLGATNLTVGGSVDLTKAPGQNLSVVGGVSAVRGYYQFQGKRFDVTRDSAITFHGEQPIDPTLSVSASQDISGVTAKVNVTGTARKPAIRLSSDPPLDEGDVLSLIVFGQPMNQLGESQRVNLAQRAGMLAASALADPLSDSIGRALNLDMFEIRAAGDNGAGPSVSLGRQVGSRLFIGLRQEFGKEDISAVSFEYRLSSLLRLVTSVAQGAQQTHRTRRNDPTGVDLIFVIRY